MFNYSFLTAKPVVLAINAREESLSQSFKNFNAGKYVQVVFSGIIEEEIMSLPEPDQIAFLESYGLKESGVSRIGKEVYACLNLLTFFTVENNEVRAWSIPKGFTAKEAAGKIHTDMERGFIRAEVVSYRDLHRLGSLKACKDKGVLRLEGKDYQVKDGDILNIRFNV